MSAVQQPVHAAPFDAVAKSYDDTFSFSRIGRVQRAAVWRMLAKTFHPGNRILEIGSGTGVDACFLAGRGIHVVATDSSPEMMDVVARKVDGHGLRALVKPLVLSAEQLSTLPTNEKFDGAFSNFGAMNCIAGLPLFARDLAARMNPGATALLCWMGPFCLWETMWYLAHGDRRKAIRRLNKAGVSAKIADGAFVRVYYPTARQIVHSFGPGFRLKSITGIGVSVPPSYVEAWAQKHPGMLNLCERADFFLSRIPGLRMLADHILIGLERKATNEATPTEGNP
jgi:SAM-dependent methyltransferase